LGKNCIGTGVADQFREDLKEAGIGEGAHGFKIKVTPVPADGVEYELKLVDQNTGRAIRAKSFKFKSEDTATISIESVDFGCVNGIISNLIATEAHIPVLL